MATLAMNSGLWVRRLLIGGSPFQGRYPASEVNDGTCPEKTDHLKALAKESLSDSKIDKLLRDGTLAKVRFHCSARVYSFIRAGNRRYPSEQMRLSGPLPTDDWTVDVEGVQLLTPDPDNSAHPYPVELLLPAWTVDSYDFTSWLFGFGGELRIEAPAALRDKHRAFGQGIAALYEVAEQAVDDSQAIASP
jgi:hypothetical protein